jgi:integrase
MDHVAGGVRFQIYERTRKRSARCLICYHVGSRRAQVTFRGGIDDAKKHCKNLARTVTSGEALDALHLTALDRRIYVLAKELLAPHGRAVDAVAREFAEASKLLGSGVTLRAAAEFWAAHHVTTLPRATVAEVLAEMLAFLAHNKRRAGVTTASLKSLLTPFAAAFQMPIAEVGTAQIETWLGKLRHAPRTLNNYRAAILRLFNFARGRYLPKEAPTAAAKIEQITEERGAVTIFRPWEMASILTHASEALLPCIAIGGFAGVRTKELCRMEWSAVQLDKVSADFPHGYIEITKAVAKQHRTAARRLIPVQANLARWLEPYRFRTGPVSPYAVESSLCRAITRLIGEINEREAKQRRRTIGRPENGLRHSYGSYRLPKLASAAALAIEMNNSEAEIWRDYRELAPPSDVEAWWNIMPVDDVLGLFRPSEKAVSVL